MEHYSRRTRSLGPRWFQLRFTFTKTNFWPPWGKWTSTSFRSGKYNRSLTRDTWSYNTPGRGGLRSTRRHR